jgi:hypothetical protein
MLGNHDGEGGEVVDLLEDMLKEVVALRKERPRELKGNYHSLEEWEEELVAAVKDVGNILGNESWEVGADKLVEIERGLRLLRT